MKVLFVSSWNKSKGISPIIKNQGESLKNNGIEIEYYGLYGTGLKGYLKNIKPLRKFLKNNNFDIIHAHYSLSGFIVALAGAKNIIVSLMGSDVKGEKKHRLLIKFFNFFYWKKCIVKSEDMKISSGLKKADIIPNGVDLQTFTTTPKDEAIKKTGWKKDKKHILFPANPERKEKNFELAEKAIASITNEELKLHYFDNVKNEDTALYYSATDIVLLTSLWEGSPNVIKEAMACNCPIVSTNIGDVKWLLGDEAGHFISNFNTEYVTEKIKQALLFSETQKHTKGRERIIKLSLDANTIAIKIINLYKKIITK